MVTAETFVLLLGAGFMGGMANSMAGGASLITFPAMMAAGLAPFPANASNTVALIFGNIMGAFAERDKLQVIDRSLWISFAIAALGGALGAMLLLVTPEKLFVLIVPGLIGLATFIFAYAKKIQMWLAQYSAAHSQNLRATLMFPTAVYGGYFGAGMGVIFMAVLSATSNLPLRSLNALKNVLGVLANGAAIVVFIFQDVVSWPQTLVMMAGCIVGGYAGGKALNVISASTMRKAIICIGSAMTLYYAWRYWL